LLVLQHTPYAVTDSVRVDVISPPLYALVPAASITTSVVVIVGAAPGVVEVPLVHPEIIEITANRQTANEIGLVRVLFM
jgi:hypothetical protein